MLRLPVSSVVKETRHAASLQRGAGVGLRGGCMGRNGAAERGGGKKVFNILAGNTIIFCGGYNKMEDWAFL